MSHRVMQTLQNHAPDVELYSIDESFLHLEGIRNPEEFAVNLRNIVRQHTKIPVSIGIGRTKTLSKVANKIAKKGDGVYNIYQLGSKYINALQVTDIRDVWGIGHQYAKLLNAHDIRNAFQFIQVKDDWVKKSMTVVGLRTLHELRGIKSIAIEDTPPPKRQIICSRAFSRSVTDFHELSEAVAFYISRAAEKLRKQDSITGNITVFIHTSRFKANSYSKSTNIDLSTPTAYTPTLIEYATFLLKKIYRAGLEYKKAGVIFNDISPDTAIQQNLFAEAPNPKHKELMQLMDKLNKDHGANTVRIATMGARQDWKMKQEMKSPSYTTKWNEQLNVK